VNWAVRWGGLAACGAVLAAYALSATRLWILGYGTSETLVRLHLWRGRLDLQIWDGATGHPLTGFRLEAVPLSETMYSGWRQALGWLWDSYTVPPTGIRRVELGVPLWSVALLTAPVCVTAWRRQPKRGGCPACNYDLSGLPPGSPCPECAAAPRP
jgi:hypothetical protein